jgi:hypothetical protein
MKFDLSLTLEVLSSTPETLSSMLGSLSDQWTQSSGDRDNWAPYDVVAHLIHGDQNVWIPRAEVILNQAEDRSFPPFDRFGQFEMYKEEPLSQVLDDFRRVRATSLGTLNSWELTDDKLDLQGIHPEFGEVRLRELLAAWTVHDLTHIRQIVTAMAKRYDAAVGPWKEYLSILD